MNGTVTVRRVNELFKLDVFDVCSRRDAGCRTV
jgi:hypothetical protein